MAAWSGCLPLAAVEDGSVDAGPRPDAGRDTGILPDTGMPPADTGPVVGMDAAVMPPSNCPTNWTKEIYMAQYSSSPKVSMCGSTSCHGTGGGGATNFLMAPDTNLPKSNSDMVKATTPPAAGGAPTLVSAHETAAGLGGFLVLPADQIDYLKTVVAAIKCP